MDRHSSCGDECHLRQEHEKPGDRHKGVSEVKGGQREWNRPRRRVRSDRLNATTWLGEIVQNAALSYPSPDWNSADCGLGTASK